MRVVKKIKGLTQSGDTIVEVLLVLTIIGLVLGSATAMSSRSTSNLQQTQESAVADRIARGQLEYLKTYVRTLKDKDIATVSALNSNFCMAAQNGKPNDPKVPKSGEDACATTQVEGGASYKTAIAVSQVSGSSGVFDVHVKVTWEGLNVREGNIDVYYRIYNITGAGVALQTGQLCQPGYRKKDVATGTGPCVPIDPSIRAVTRAVTPDKDVWGGLVEPNCNKADYGPLNGVSIRLSEIGAGASAPKTATTTQDFNGLSSSVLFSPLKKSGTYRVEMLGVPSNYITCGTTQSGALKVEEGQEEVFGFIAKPRIPKQASVSPTSHNFPAWHLATSTGTRQSIYFTFTNPSSSTTSLDNVSVTSTDPTNFRIWSHTCYGSLQPGASCSALVYFWPPSDNTAATNYLGNSGLKSGMIKFTNSNGVTPTSASVSGKTLSNTMAPHDFISGDKKIVAWSSTCYNNADTCPYPTYLSSNGDLILSGSYCVWGRWGGPHGQYDGNSSVHMQLSDGNFVFYRKGGTAPWNSLPQGVNTWAVVYDNGHMNLTRGYYGDALRHLYNINNNTVLGVSCPVEE